MSKVCRVEEQGSASCKEGTETGTLELAELGTSHYLQRSELSVSVLHLQEE